MGDRVIPYKVGDKKVLVINEDWACEPDTSGHKLTLIPKPFDRFNRGDLISAKCIRACTCGGHSDWRQIDES